VGTLIIANTGLGECEAHVEGCADLKKKRYDWVVEREVGEGVKAKAVVADFFYDDFKDFGYATRAEYEAATPLEWFGKIFPCAKKAEVA